MCGDYSQVSTSTEDTRIPKLQHKIKLFRKINTIKYRWRVYLCKCLYFLIFYVTLLAFFTIYLNLLMYFHIKRDYPTLTGFQSALQLNPGLSMVPVPDVYSSLIYTSGISNNHFEPHIAQIVSFLTNYRVSGGRTELAQCVNQPYKFNPLRPCAFDLNMVGPCCLDNAYGYNGESPCVLLKMNKIYGWLPDPVPFASGVIVKCQGYTEDDTYNLGDMRYFDLEYLYESYKFGEKKAGKVGNGSFHHDFFPYLNQPQYQQPFVFVTFENMQKNVLVRVQCFLIAKNIHVDIARNEGSITFELLVD